jgi:predicted nuclease with TOPRIM domain
VREEAEAAEIISKAYTQLQESYVDMIAAIKESYKECNDKMELLMTEVEELRKENKKLIKENEALCEQIKVLEQLIADLKDEVSKE